MASAGTTDWLMHRVLALHRRCLVDYDGQFEAMSPQNLFPRCTFGADAIVDAMTALGSRITYERKDFCEMVNQPTDTSFTPMFESKTTDMGHDSASHFYASTHFVDWLLARRLSPAHRWWR